MLYNEFWKAVATGVCVPPYEDQWYVVLKQAVPVDTVLDVMYYCCPYGVDVAHMTAGKWTGVVHKQYTPNEFEICSVFRDEITHVMN